MRGLLGGGDSSIFYNNHFIEEVGEQANRAILRITEEKHVQKHEKNDGITSFSHYAAEEGELRIVRPRGDPGFLHRNFFFRNSCPLRAKFFNEKSLNGRTSNVFPAGLLRP